MREVAAEVTSAKIKVIQQNAKSLAYDKNNT